MFDPIWEDEIVTDYNDIRPGILDKLVARIRKWKNRNQPKELTYADVYRAIVRSV